MLSSPPCSHWTGRAAFASPEIERSDGGEAIVLELRRLGIPLAGCGGGIEMCNRGRNRGLSQKRELEISLLTVEQGVLPMREATDLFVTGHDMGSRYAWISKDPITGDGLAHDTVVIAQH